MPSPLARLARSQQRYIKTKLARCLVVCQRIQQLKRPQTRAGPPKLITRTNPLPMSFGSSKHTTSPSHTKARF